MNNSVQVTEDFRIARVLPSGTRLFYAGYPVWVPGPAASIVVYATHAEARTKLVSLAYGGWTNLQVVYTRRTVTEEETVVSELLSGKALKG